MLHAKDFKCCEKKCKNKAVAFFPVFDPDIPQYPYCRECLDKLKLKLIINFSEINNKPKT